jgi:hypothetical protein
MVGAGVAALGLGIIWLSKDTEGVKFDDKIHTIEKLYDVLEDIYLEYACSYIYYYNMIVNLRDQG